MLIKIIALFWCYKQLVINNIIMHCVGKPVKSAQTCSTTAATGALLDAGHL